LNCYFEATPLDLFTGIVTERGTLDVPSARSLAASFEVHPVLAEALEQMRE
jgi:methylthioribose-1-phosphate isomerase